MLALQPACQHCRAAVPADARFCPHCGTPLAPAAAPAAAGERRQVAVLFADLTGYTALSSALDPEEIHRILTRYFELVDGVVAQHGGTVDKHIGDAVMAVFGAPVAHGNDTLRALRASLAVHAAMATLAAQFGRPLAAHVGVASGEVVAADTGSDVHRHYTMTGDAVNLAARLTDLARAGETVIADGVHDACAADVDAESAGAVAIRGLAGEVPVWKLRGLRHRSDAPALVGRDAEMTRFAALLAQVRSTGRGLPLVVRADPGMGKTRLTQAMVERAQRDGWRTHAAAVLDFGGAQGRDAIHALFASLLGVPPDAATDDRRAVLDAALAAARLAADDEAFAADLLGVPQRASASYEAMDDATRTQGRLRTLAAVATHAAMEAPVLLLVEDVHWATPWIRRCVHSIAHASIAASLLLACTTRREGDPFAGEPLGERAEVFDLQPLADDAALALAASFAPAGDAAARRCVARAQGNPLFLTQLLRSNDDDAALPGTIQSVVQSRLDRLPPADKRALQAAAVVGQRFDLALLRHLLEDAAYDAGALLNRDLVHAEPDAAHRFRFVHALIRDGAYASLLHSTRRALHLRAAGWFVARDAVLAAEHLDRAGDERAAAAYLVAARAEAAALRFDSALRLARRGGELPAAPDVACDLARCEGDLARDAGDVPASLTAFRRALAHAPTPAARCAAQIGIVAGLRASGAVAEGLAEVATLEPLAQSAQLPTEASRAAYLRGRLEFARGDAAASRAAQERALAQARAAGDAECEAQALSGLADVLYAEGRMHSALAAFRQCVALCDREGLARFALNNRAMLAIVHSYLEPADGAVGELDRVRAVARELRHPASQVMADETEAWVRLVQGACDEAVPLAERSLALAREIGAKRWVLFDLGLLAYAYWHAGRPVDARDALAQAIAIGEEVGSRFVGGMLLGARALMSADPAELDTTCAAFERDAAGGPAHGHFWFRREAIDAALRHGDLARAADEAAKLAAFTRTEPLPLTDFVVERARVLADAARGVADAAAIAQCLARGEALRLHGALPALRTALARRPAVE
ncbi:MAG: adenylate/guanylate cyclase domain-containing protein [Burkholderiales bacterium]